MSPPTYVPPPPQPPLVSAPSPVPQNIRQVQAQQDATFMGINTDSITGHPTSSALSSVTPYSYGRIMGDETNKLKLRKPETIDSMAVEDVAWETSYQKEKQHRQI